jgi:hypothetical protein
MVEKKTKTILKCTCDLKGCGKSWESEGKEIPERCRWCGRRTWNGQDRRSHRITAKGKTQRISEWAKETGIGKATIRARVVAGWSPEQALGFEGRSK